MSFPKAWTPERLAESEFAPLHFREHLYSAFPVESMAYLEIGGTEHFAEPGTRERVKDYFAAFGAPYPQGASATALSQAWGYLSIEPGHWAECLEDCRGTYDFLEGDLSAFEQAYVEAIAQDDWATARKLFGEMRWVLGLRQELRANA